MRTRPLTAAALAAVAAVSVSGCSGARHHAPAAAAPARAGRGTRRPRLVRALPYLTHGPRDRRRLVALTFDADMTPFMLAKLRSGAVHGWFDRSIVSELEATRTPATIFLTGLWARTYPAAVRALAHDPLFELEDHSWDHDGFEHPCYGLARVRGAAEKRAEVTRARAAILAAGAPPPRYFRFPGGCHSAADVRLVEALGERPVGWDVISGDPFQPDPVPIERAVESGVRAGSIVVMHIVGAPNAPATSRALRAIIPALRARGFHFATLRRVLRG